MRRGIMAAAAIAVARPLWLSLIVDRTISMHRGRPMRTRTVFSLVLSLLLFAGGEAFAAERRVALVIGNSSYIHAPALDNPVNDVTAVSVMLEGAGFQVVETRNNLDNTAMRRVIREFSAMTRDADVAVVFYAGHGLEVDGINYLIPTDAKLASDIDVEDEAISLDRVLRVLEPAKSLRLVILDACRDNPFVKTMKRTLASRSFGRGLAGVEPAMSNTLIAFAAKAGSTANDGDGAHSPFTTALLKHLTAPGLDLRIAFGKVRDEVLASTGARQEPHVYGSLGGTTIALVPAGEVSGAATAAPAPGGDVGRDVARLRIRHAGRHQGGMGRVPGCASDRLLRRPCARPTRQALGRARGSAGRGAGPGGFDAVAARTGVAGQAIGAAPCRQSARASEAKAGEGDGLGRRQPEPLVIVVRLQLCQAGRGSRHRGRARQWRRADRFRQEVLRRLRSPRSCCRPPASILRSLRA